MTEPAGLPLFVREALDGDAGEGRAASSGAALSAVDVERSLLALERALGFEAAGFEAAGFEAAGSNVRGGEAALPDALRGEVEFARVLGRLERTVVEPPYRYAPFFARAAELFDLPEDAVVAEFERLRDPKAWSFAGLPGISHVAVKGGPRVQSAETLFVRFKPGVYFPGHQHTGLERVLVLEGSYEDSNGVLHRPGELREWPSGTAHSFKVSSGEPCIFASVVFGRRFDAWPLRALAKLLGR